MGALAELEGKFDDAAALYKKAIELDPDNYEAWGNLGSAYLWGGNHEQSTQAYRKAAELANAEQSKSPNDPQSYRLCWPDIMRPQDRERKVRSSFARRSHFPLTTRKSNYRAGETYEILGQRAKAIPLIARALAQGYHVTEFQRSPELAALRSDPAFQSALNKAKSENPVDTARKLN